MICEKCEKNQAEYRAGELALCSGCLDDFKIHAVAEMHRIYGKQVKISFDMLIKPIEGEDN